MSTLRRDIGGRLPGRWANHLRGAVRALDQLAGLPRSSRRPGAVCMFHVGRCGSSVLGEMLNQHPRLRWDGEIYHHHWTRHHQRGVRWRSEAYLRRHMWSAGSRWYGFEMKFLPQQHLAILGLSLPEYLAELERARVTRYVILRRRNSLRRLISAAAGVRTGQRHVGVNDPEPARQRVHFDVTSFRLARSAPPMSLVASLDQIEESYAELRARLADHDALELSFEDDVAAQGPHVAYGRVCRHLGVEPAIANPHTRRMHAAPVEELLSNYDEVATALRATQYEWMLEKDAPPTGA